MLDRELILALENTPVYEAVDNIEQLPKFTGIAYRSDTGFKHDKGMTVLGVIKYESEELGNDGQFVNLSPNLKLKLDSIPAERCVWVTKSKAAALNYGEPELFEVGDGAKILATDGDGGYLLLLGEPK